MRRRKRRGKREGGEGVQGGGTLVDVPQGHQEKLRNARMHSLNRHVLMTHLSSTVELPR